MTNSFGAFDGAVFMCLQICIRVSLYNNKVTRMP